MSASRNAWSFFNFVLALYCVLVQCSRNEDNTSELEDPPTPQVDAPENFPFHIGIALKSQQLQSPKKLERIEQYFNSLTPEFELKHSIINPFADQFDFSSGDHLVEYAQQKNLHIHGHVLIWHGATAPWLENFSGTKEEFETYVRDYIHKTMKHFAHKITDWDVVNEAFEGETLRKTVFLRFMGPDYIKKCFQYANEANPEARLFYNDYDFENPSKRKAILNLLRKLLQESVPIHGIGNQSHISLEHPNAIQYRESLADLASLGLLVHISELDVRVNPDAKQATLNRYVSRMQAQRYQDIVQAYSVVPSHQRYGISLWGLSDADTWIRLHMGNLDWPLLFDENLEPKLAFSGFFNGLERIGR